MANPRIISGTLRGIRLKSVPGSITRPITDRVKEALFNLIGPDIQRAFFLDLFGGTGSVGIEALSRGAEFVQFVEKNHMVYSVLVENLARVKMTGKAAVIKDDAFTYVSKENKQFDYIYIAPPQYKSLWKKMLSAIDTHPDLMSNDAWIIAQINPKEFEEISLMNLVEFDRRDYGSTRLVFYINR